MKINAKKFLLFFLLSRWLLLCGCSSTIKAPAVRLVPVYKQAMPRMTMQESNRLRPVVYFKTSDPRVDGYTVTWQGMAGGLILQKDMGTAYKDTVRVWPIKWFVRAYDEKGKLGKTSKTLVIE